MKKLAVLSLIFSGLLFLSFSSSHPVGRSGAPGDGLCSDCHSGGGGFDGEISISGVPSNPVPGQVYDVTMTLEVISGAPVRGGFQVVSLRSADDTQAGTWSNPDGSSSLKTGSGRVYFGHEPFRNFGGNPTVSWDAEWEAPSITDEVIFYMAGNFANGNGSNSGDLIVSDQYAVDIVVIDPIEIDFIEIMGVDCNGDNNGVAVADASGGTPPYEYEWDNGETGAQAIALTGGMHMLTVTDDDGTEAVASVTIPEPDEIDIDFEEIMPSCFGEDDGMIIVEAFGGTGDLECMWFGFGNDCTIEDLEPGIYELTVTDENNCTFTMEFELEEPEELILDMSSTDASASNNDGTATCVPSGGTSEYTFDWSNGDSEVGLMSTITGLAPGSYFVTVTDENDCREVGEIDVDGINCTIQTSISSKDVSCYGGSDGSADLSVTGARQPVSYIWSNGANTMDITGLSAAWYYVTVTDADMCTAIDSVEILQPDSLMIDSSMVQHIECLSDSTGSVYVYLSGGTAPYSYFWSNGQTNDTIVNGIDVLVNPADSLDGLTNGIYYLTVTDSQNCMLIDSFAIEVLDSIAPVLTQGIVELYLDESGLVLTPELSVINGYFTDNCAVESVDYTQALYDCADIGVNLLGITVHDQAGNSAMYDLEFMVIDDISPTIVCSVADTTINSCAPFEYELPEVADNCGVSAINQTGGFPSGEIFPEGVTVMVFEAVDASSNSASCSMTVTVENDLDVVFTVTSATCAGNDGSIELMISGGTPPYMVDPSGLDGLIPGDYIVTVTDASGCIVVSTIIVDQVELEFDYEIITTDASCFDSNDGSVMVEVDGDPADFSIIYESGVDPDNLSAGEYSVTITEIESSCTAMGQFEITQPGQITITDEMLTTDPCTGELENLDLDISGGTSPYTAELIDNGDNVEILITDVNGCVYDTVIQIELIDLPLNLIDFSITVLTGGGDGGLVSPILEGGTEPYTYVWTDDMGNTISTEMEVELPNGTYCLEVTDALGCVVTGKVVVDITDSIEDLEFNNSIKLYPNPTLDVLNIEYEANATQVVVELYDLNSKLLEKIQLNNQSKLSLDMKDLEQGVYLLVLRSEDNRFYRMVSKI